MADPTVIIVGVLSFALGAFFTWMVENKKRGNKSKQGKEVIDDIITKDKEVSE